MNHEPQQAPNYPGSEPACFQANCGISLVYSAGLKVITNSLQGLSVKTGCVLEDMVLKYILFTKMKSSVTLYGHFK